MTVQGPSTDLTVRQLGAITIVEFQDRRLIDTARIERLGEQILQLVNKTPSIRLIISFDRVEYLSSTMLNVLIGIDNAVKRSKGKLVLACVDAEIQKIFTLMKLHKVMTLCNTMDEAMGELK